MKPLFLHGLSYTVGELVPLATLPSLTDGQKEGFTRAGLERISRFDGPLTALIDRVLRETLAATRLEPAAIGAVIVATSAYWQAEECQPAALGRVLTNNGLGHCDLVMTSILSCVNFANVVRCARNLIAGEGVGHVLVVTADIAPPGDRMVYGDTSLLGDGAACCAVSCGVEAGYRLVSVARHDEHGMDVAGFEDRRVSLIKKIDAIFAGMKRLVVKLQDASGLAPGDMQAFVANNYTKFIHQYTMTTLGFRGLRTWTDNIARFGHVFSSDNLINLFDLDREGRLAAGDRVFLLGTGVQNFGAVILEKV